MFYPTLRAKKRAEGIREQYLKGTPIGEIAKNFNLKFKTSVYYYLNKYGGLSPADKALYVLKTAEHQQKEQEKGGESENGSTL